MARRPRSLFGLFLGSILKGLFRKPRKSRTRPAWRKKRRGRKDI